MVTPQSRKHSLSEQVTFAFTWHICNIAMDKSEHHMIDHHQNP